MLISVVLLASATLAGTPVYLDIKVPNKIPAYQMFCRRYPEAVCTSTSAGTVALDADTRTILTTVQHTVNASMTYRPEREDVWTIGGRAGDCDDFAVTKRQRLIEQGLPANALSLAIVRWHKKQHMVLLVRTTTDTLVLDSLVPDVVSWSDPRFAPFTWMLGTDHGVWKLMGRRR